MVDDGLVLVVGEIGIVGNVDSKPGGKPVADYRLVLDLDGDRKEGHGIGSGVLAEIDLDPLRPSAGSAAVVSESLRLNRPLVEGRQVLQFRQDLGLPFLDIAKLRAEDARKSIRRTRARRQRGFDQVGGDVFRQGVVHLVPIIPHGKRRQLGQAVPTTRQPQRRNHEEAEDPAGRWGRASHVVVVFLDRSLQASSPDTTSPWISVRRKRRPWKR